MADPDLKNGKPRAAKDKPKPRTPPDLHNGAARKAKPAPAPADQHNGKPRGGK